MEKGNILADLPDARHSEHFDTLLQLDEGHIERIVSQGQCSPEHFWYDQHDNEWILVLTGRAGLQFEDEAEIVELGPGDYLNIPAHVRHRVAWTAEDVPTVWLAVHY